MFCCLPACVCSCGVPVPETSVSWVCNNASACCLLPVTRCIFVYFLFFFLFIYPAHHTPSQIIVSSDSSPRERERERECAALHLDPLGGHSQVIAYTVTLRVWYGRKNKNKATNPVAFCDFKISSFETVCGLFSPAFVALCLCVNKCINPWQTGETVLSALLSRKTVFDPCSNFLFKATPSSQQPSLQTKVNTRLGNGRKRSFL